MQMLQRGPYWSWVTIDGTAVDVYDVQQSGNLVTCWIASEVGKKFAVNWYNSTRDIPLKASLYIDGVHCDTHIMLDARSFPDKPNGVGVSYARTSEYTRRDFVFAPIQVTDDDNLLDQIDDSRDLGVIKLQLWRIQVHQVTTRVQRHEKRRTLEAQVVHERSKKAGSHHVQFGQEYASPAPVIDAVEAREIDAKPYLTFEFKYRPLDLLIAHEIAPRVLYTLSPTPDIPDDPEDTGSEYAGNASSSLDREMGRLEARLRTTRTERRDRLTLPNFKVRVKREVIDLT
ncbi:hypothetical protein D9756_001290 [Leucocoprinus leucothites]|uniref:DUF7918 domain-containing protein n=1 Tax=Leucocoprinus leucothites TaxID=201217 RepID=A0A8H5LIA4_9AGAR|nr:hypothetical protein D9756_001290 [Leucoagaricus leucothites]